MPGLLSLTLLGGFEATIPGGALPRIPKKTQALLAFLALEGGMRPRVELATLLWGDTGDEQALQSLRRALSGLRQAMGESSYDVLRSHERSVGINRAVVDVDVAEFERLANEADPAAAGAALAQYRGHLLAGLDLDEAPFNEWLLSRRERLRELALNTLGRLLDHQVGRGEVDPAIATASRLLELEPLSEPAHRALIQLYGRQGRRAAAARQYQLCVEALQRELGVKPEPATEAAYRQSLEAAPVDAGATARPPQMPAPPAAPPAIVAAPKNRGFVIPAALAVAVFVAAVAAYGYWRPRPVGAPMSRRSVAILPMKNLSEQPEHAWLSTALTETIGAELMAGEQFRLVSSENLDRMQQALSPPLGVGLTRKQLDDIGRTLGCDLVMSGGYLAVGGNIRVDVRLDDVASGEPVANSSVSGADADLLALVDRAGNELRSRLGVGEAGAPDRAAIRAAFPSTSESRRLYFLGLDALRLRDGPKAAELLEQATAAEPNLALAHVALITTWKLLGEDSRAAESAKRALASADRLSPEDRLNVEATAAEASFDWNKAEEGYGRLWKMYPDNIEYGLKLANAQQVAGHYKDADRTIAEMHKLPGVDGGDPRIDLVEGTVAEKVDDYKRALAAATRAADTALATRATLLLARARLKQGIYHSRLNEPDKAAERMAEGRQLFESLGDRGGVADALRWEAGSLAFQNRFDAATPKLAEALAIAKPLGYVRLTTEILLQQAIVARAQGDFKAALQPLEAALVTAREGGEPDALARTVNTLAATLRTQGEYTRARALYVEGADIYRKLGSPVQVSTSNATINNIAVIDLLQGRFDEARTAYEQLLAEDRKRDDKANMALRLANLSLVHTMQGHLSDAEPMNAEACKLYEGLGNKASIASCRIRLGIVWARMGRSKEALTMANGINADDLAGSSAPPWDFARLITLYLETDQRAKAEKAVADGLRMFGTKYYAPDFRLQFELARARVEAATGKSAAATARARTARQEAERLGLTPLVTDFNALIPPTS